MLVEYITAKKQTEKKKVNSPQTKSQLLGPAGGVFEGGVFLKTAFTNATFPPTTKIPILT